MLASIPMEFWTISQVAVDLVLLLVVYLFWRKASAASQGQPSEKALLAVSRVLEPVLTEARSLAGAFETQLQEKRAIIKKLNQDLDARIISLNLLLNRAESRMAPQGGASRAEGADHVMDLQQKIITLGSQGLAVEDIAAKLQIPRGEVEMVLALKRKFDKMADS